MGKKSPPPKPPDLTPISDAQLQIAKDSNELAREFLGMSREQFAYMQENAQEELALARTQADRLFEFQNKAFASDEEAKAFAREVGQTQIDAMNLQADYAKRDRARYEDTFLPMQDEYIAEAKAYDTPERRESEASRQMVDVQRQAEAQRANADQTLRSMGIDPSQVRSSSMMNQMAVATGANQALAGNNARTQIEDKGRALRADAINMGNGLPAQAAAGFQGANASGAGAVNAGAAGQNAALGAINAGAGVGSTAMGFRSNALNNLSNLTGSPMQWASMGQGGLGQASNAYGSAASTMNQNYQNQQQHWQAKQDQSQQAFSNITSVAGMAAGMMMSGGGVVPTRRQMLSAGGVVSRVAPAVPKQAVSVDRMKPSISHDTRGPDLSWRAKLVENARKSGTDPYVRTGDGRGEGGALSWQDRVHNGLAGANAGALPSVGSRYERPQEVLRQMPMMSGGGAIPVEQSRDTIDVTLTGGEYIVPRDVVQAKGIEFFDRLSNKYHRELS